MKIKCDWCEEKEIKVGIIKLLFGSNLNLCKDCQRYHDYMNKEQLRFLRQQLKDFKGRKTK